MTTTVLIGTQGNKAVRIETPNGPAALLPGRWFTLTIHGDQCLSIHETGEFINAGPTLHYPPRAAVADSVSVADTRVPVPVRVFEPLPPPSSGGSYEVLTASAPGVAASVSTADTAPCEAEPPNKIWASPYSSASLPDGMRAGDVDAAAYSTDSSSSTD